MSATHSARVVKILNRTENPDLSLTLEFAQALFCV